MHKPFITISEDCKRIYRVDMDDIYFSTEGGLAEKNYVFIQSSQLIQRLSTHRQPVFTIAEIGFGTGLNYLLTLREYAKQALVQSCPELRYISIEKYPIPSEALITIHQSWPELSVYSQELLSFYQQIDSDGVYEFQLNNSIRLTLLVGDIEVMLPKIETDVDSWYLDGFSPAKNPQMWSPQLFSHIGKYTHPDGYVVTYSAASFIRKALAEQGFTVIRQKGFGHKRHMLVAWR